MAISLRKAEDCIVYGPEQDCIVLVSPPGTGKSSIVARAAKRIGAAYLPVYAATMEAVDARGLPMPVRHDDSNKFMVGWAAPSFLPLELEAAKYGSTQVLVNFDDWFQAPPPVLRATVRSIYGDGGERRIGDFPVYKNTRFVATGNREQDRAGVYRPETYVNDRITYIEVEPNVDDWVSGAMVGFAPPEPITDYAEVRAKINAEVAKGIPDWLIAYVKAFAAVYAFTTEARSFLSPRSIERAGRFDRAFDAAGITDCGQGDGTIRNTDILHEVLCGTVGEAEAVKMSAFKKLRDKIPSVADILKGQDVKLPATSDILYITCASLLRAADKEHCAAIAKFISRMCEHEVNGMKIGVEVGAYLFKECLNGEAGKKLRGIRTVDGGKFFVKWLETHGKYWQ